MHAPTPRPLNQKPMNGTHIMRTAHLTLEELERHAYVTGDQVTARACQRGLDTEQEALEDARQSGYDEGHDEGEAFGYDIGFEEGVDSVGN
jgi:flagellar biosynthesis/type III secretory pathway protein FliH